MLRKERYKLKSINVAKLYEDSVLPTRKNSPDAGLDLYAYGSYILPQLSTIIVRTGITTSIPEGYVGLIKQKSKHNWIVGAGVVDAGYQGELLVKLVNPSNEIFVINNESPIAQLLIQMVELPEVKEVDKDTIHSMKTSRGSTGGILNYAESTKESL